MGDLTEVWVFNGVGGRFPSGVFTSREKAEEWIARHGLYGTLTAYPLDQGVYNWAVERGVYKPKPTDDAGFVGRFSSAHQDHSHYEPEDEGACRPLLSNTSWRAWCVWTGAGPALKDRVWNVFLVEGVSNSGVRTYIPSRPLIFSSTCPKRVPSPRQHASRVCATSASASSRRELAAGPPPY